MKTLPENSTPEEEKATLKTIIAIKYEDGVDDLVYDYNLEKEGIEGKFNDGSKIFRFFIDRNDELSYDPISGVSDFMTMPSPDGVGDLDLPDAMLQEQAETLLATVQNLIAESSNYDEVMDKLYELYPAMNDSQIEESLGQAIFASQMWGRLNNDD